jgi:toxic protein SymE
MQNFRNIKIQDKFERRKWANKLVPSLKLQGEWLREAGFTSGENCSIKVERGRLTIIAL